MSDTPRCKEMIIAYFGGFPQGKSNCKRAAIKDGYCKQHHPDTVQERRGAARARFDAKMKALTAPHEKIKALERELTAEKERSARLERAVRGLLGLIRGAQDQMSLYIQPDGDADTTLDNLLYLLDGPKQREVEKEARSALGDTNG